MNGSPRTNDFLDIETLFTFAYADHKKGLSNPISVTESGMIVMDHNGIVDVFWRMDVFVNIQNISKNIVEWISSIVDIHPSQTKSIEEHISNKVMNYVSEEIMKKLL